jgi:ElaA protein
MNFKAKFFDELATLELYRIVQARTEIFLLEQRIICQDFDGVDLNALHCFLEQDGKVMAYLRAYRVEGGDVKIGRVLSITHGIGLGTKLMQQSIGAIREKMGDGSIVLNAQQHAEGFYAQLGFKVASPVFMEECIPHVKMVL